MRQFGAEIGIDPKKEICTLKMGSNILSWSAFPCQMRHWKEIGFRQSSAESEKNGTLQWYHK
jgi:hypothetical protein